VSAEAKPTPEQREIISNIAKALRAVSVCGLTLNEAKVNSDIAKVGLGASDLAEGGRFWSSIRQAWLAFDADFTQLRKEGVDIPKDVMCAGWSVGFGDGPEARDHRDWLR